jgi:hypothetical protein
MAFDEDLADPVRDLLAFVIGGNMAAAASGQAGVLVWVETGASDARALPAT